jgi:hypothetical protein
MHTRIPQVRVALTAAASRRIAWAFAWTKSRAKRHYHQSPAVVDEAVDLFGAEAAAAPVVERLEREQPPPVVGELGGVTFSPALFVNGEQYRGELNLAAVRLRCSTPPSRPSVRRASR